MKAFSCRWISENSCFTLKVQFQITDFSFQTHVKTFDEHVCLFSFMLEKLIFLVVSEIYRIVSQKQITDGGGDMDKPGGSQTINLQPTLTDNKPNNNPCCNK